MEIIKGDLIALAKEGKFDVIGHGCNCFCTMKRGLAPKMAEAFGCDKFPLEHKSQQGNINKLGQIDYRSGMNFGDPIIVNMYTQYHWSHADLYSGIPLNYSALRLCLQKLNHEFKGKHIGLPWVGCGLAKGARIIVSAMIKKELKDCKVTIVEYEAR